MQCFFFSSRRRHTRQESVSWARRCVQETGVHGDNKLSLRTLKMIGSSNRGYESSSEEENLSDFDDEDLDEETQRQLESNLPELIRYDTASIQDMINNVTKNVDNTITNKGKNTKTANYLKILVSKQKKRFAVDGFDLDLTYITERIIAMGYPAVTFEKIYRNSMEDVKKFLNFRHSGHFRVYNL
eukprot:TRINITY_DN3345_c0_g1_i15.p2 TRINITY_DN3345_c0_g1~~TRINITY_DN3345_c0_g1_i15.p2  ORF type:complete len:185 (-),score=55.87 TRINITY_DN3345_c0_g1_i15:942-1496(-)